MAIFNSAMFVYQRVVSHEFTSAKPIHASRVDGTTGEVPPPSASG